MRSSSNPSNDDKLHLMSCERHENPIGVKGLALRWGDHEALGDSRCVEIVQKSTNLVRGIERLTRQSGRNIIVCWRRGSDKFTSGSPMLLYLRTVHDFEASAGVSQLRPARTMSQIGG